MNKKIISSVITTLMIVGATSFTAFASIPNGTAAIGGKAFDFAYANDPANIDVITDAIVAGGVVYVKNFSGKWVDNTTGLEVSASVIPAVVYKNTTGVVTLYDPADKDVLSTVAVKSVGAINITKNIGDNYTLPSTVTATLSDLTTKDLAVTWSKAANTKVVGEYTFIGTLIMANGVANPNNVTITAKLTVVDIITPITKVTTVSLNITTDSLTIGGTANLIAAVNPTDATNKAITWTSSDNNIATVNNTGRVTAVSAGTVTITVTTEDGSKTATCTIIVQPVSNSLELNKPYIAKDGMTITVTNIQKTEDVGSVKYIVSYTLKNETTDKKIDEATFKMYFEDGTNLPQYGFFGSLFPSQSISRIYTFEVLKTQKPTLIEYGADFFAVKPSLDTLKWEVR